MMRDGRRPTVIRFTFHLMKVTDLEKMGTLIPSSRVAICQRGSHCAMYDDQEVYFRELLQFIADVEVGKL